MRFMFLNKLILFRSKVYLFVHVLQIIIGLVLDHIKLESTILFSWSRLNLNWLTQSSPCIRLPGWGLFFFIFFILILIELEQIALQLLRLTSVDPRSPAVKDISRRLVLAAEYSILSVHDHDFCIVPATADLRLSQNVRSSRTPGPLDYRLKELALVMGAFFISLNTAQQVINTTLKNIQKDWSATQLDVFTKKVSH